MHRRNLLIGASASIFGITINRASAAAPNLPLKHIAQEPMLCVPTSVAMVLDYFGEVRSPRELKVLSRGKAYDANADFQDFTITPWGEMTRGLARIGYHWTERGYTDDETGFRAGIDAIKRSIDRKLPVLIDVAMYGSHTFVVTGYDKNGLLVKDPMLSAPGDASHSYGELQDIWNGVSYGYNKRPALFTARS